MAKIPTFNPAEHEAADPDRAGGGDPLPAGWYAAQLVKTDMKPTADCEKGKVKAFYLWGEFQLLEEHHPDMKGRCVWMRLNLINPNPTAEKIAKAELAALCAAANHAGPLEDSEVLHFRPVAVKVSVQPPRGNYGPSNEIKGFDRLEHRFGANAAPGAAPEKAPPSSGGKGRKAVWE